MGKGVGRDGGVGVVKKERENEKWKRGVRRVRSGRAYVRGP